VKTIQMHPDDFVIVSISGFSDRVFSVRFDRDTLKVNRLSLSDSSVEPKDETKQKSRGGK